MKKILTLLLIVLVFRQGNAQTFSEWFRQKATQKKYLLQQIAALQVYIGCVQKGYSIAKQGLDAISDFKQGELNLHTGYFQSLKTVNSKIGNYSKVTDIIAIQVKVINTCKEAMKQMKQSAVFNSNETAYGDGVYNRLLEDCLKTIEALITITTTGELGMKDDERLKQIDALHADMQGKYAFVKAFSDEVKVLAVSRVREQTDVQTIQALYGIKK